MIPASLPLATSSRAEPAALGAPASADARADEAGVREFAALLGAMLQPRTAEPTPRVTRVAVDDVADSSTSIESGTDAPEDPAGTAPAAATQVHAGTAEIGASAQAQVTPRVTPQVAPQEPARAGARSNETASGRETGRETGATAAREANGSRARASASAPASSAERPSRRPARAAIDEPASSAAAAMTAAATATTNTLDPDFAARLERVLDRMREAGHEVEVRETWRAPERQRALYEQGRTTDGPIVTWTLDSRHLEGKAADVRVNGRSSGRAYDLLHAIAREEGLRTLGPRDPGHLELPRTATESQQGAVARREADFRGAPGWDRMPGLPTMVVAPGGIGRIARVAQVAQVARVAEVAPLAAPGVGRRDLVTPPVAAASRIASTGRAPRATTLPALRAPGEGTVVEGPALLSGGARGPEATAHARAVRDLALATVPAEGPPQPSAPPPVSRTAQEGVTMPAERATRGTQDTGASGSGRDGTSGRETERDAARESSGSRAVRQGRNRGASLPGDGTARTGIESPRETLSAHAVRGGAVGASAPITPPGSLAAERVAELLAARDAQPAGTLGEIRLAMDPVRDGLDEVRLALQNGALDATLRTSDAGVARGLQSELASLARSLERQGFDGARVAVQLDAAQQARAAALDTVAASEATAPERALRGDGDAAREGREQHAAHDARRDQQHARQFGSRRPRPS